MSSSPSNASSTVGRSDADKKSGEPRHALTARIVVLMLLVSLVPLILLGAAWLTASSQQIHADNELLMTQTAEGLVSQVDEWVDKNVRILQAAARMPSIGSMKAEDQQGVTKAIQETYPWMYLVFTVGMNGQSIARSDGKPNVDYSDRTYFRDVALLGQSLAWQNLIGKTSGAPALVLAVPIRANGALVGVLAAAMSIDDLSKTVATWHKGRTGYAFLVDEHKKVISHPRKDFVTSQTDMKAHPLIGQSEGARQSGVRSYTDPEGNSSVGLSRVNRQGWVLALEQDDAEVFAELRRAQLWAGILLAATLVLVGLIAWRTATALVRPIVKLTDMADRMSMGELDVHIDIDSKDEIGMLANAFGRMQVSLRAAMERMKRPR